MNHPDTTPAHNASKPITNLLPDSGGGRFFSILLLLLIGALNLILAAPLQARPTSPTAPSSLSATGVSSSRIDLSWRDNSGNESGFTVWRSLSSGGPFSQIGSAAVNATTYSDSGLNANTTYYYRVYAYNSRGTSPASNDASATTAQAVSPPCTYSISSTSANPGSATSSGSVTVTATAGCSWNATSSATSWLTCAPANGTGNGSVTWSVTANTGTSSRTGTLTIAGQTFTVTQSGTTAAGPVNDYCSSGIVASGSSSALTGSNVGATKEAGEPNHCGNAGGKSVWWSWTAPSSGSVTISTVGSSFDTLLGVYTGTSVSTLGTIASNDDVGNGVLQSSVTFSAVAGTTYQIAVDGYNGASGNVTLNLSQAGTCTYSISQTSASPGSGGGTGSVNVTAGSGCSWNASSSATSWLTCTPTSGTGNGSVTWTATANTSTSPRTGTLTIAGQQFTVTQSGAACTYSISQSSASSGSGGGTGSVSVTAGAGCSWDATSSATSWLTCTPTSGTGNGSVTWTATANTSTSPRTGTLTIGGQTFTVTQSGAACTYSISLTSASPSSAGGTGSVSVTAGAGCSWDATSSATSWLTCTPTSGTGNGSVTWTATANTSTSTRTGTLTIAGQLFTVTQSGAACTYSISQTSGSPGSGGGTGSVSVTAGAGCSWNATSSATSWLTCTPTSGTGNGSVTWTATANTSTSTRTGTLTIGGQTFTVTQSGAACTYSISATDASPGSAGGTGSVSVTAGAGCSWNATSSATSWLTCTPVSGTGNGSVTWTATANTGISSRTGTLTIAGQPFTVTQAGATCTYSISSTSANPGAATGSGTVSVTAGAGCSWNATSSATSWLTCTPAGSSGSGSVTWTVTANTGTSSRTGTLTIAGQPFTVTQSGAACSYSLSASSANPGAAATGGTVTVTAGVGCSWTASSSATSWLTCTPANSTGNGSVTWSVTANTSTSSRTGTLTIGGQVYTVSQAGAAADYPPTTSLMTPGNNSTISGSVTFSASATDDHGIARVEFWCDGSLLLGTVTAAPYNLPYDTASIPNGSRTFTCKAFDNAGNSTMSSANTATVSNTSTAGPWVRQFGTTGGEVGQTVTTDGSGNAVVAGYFQGSVDFGGGALTSAGGYDMVIAKYSAAGAHLWSKRFGGAGDEFVKRVAVDASGNVFVGGNFRGTTDLGGGPLTSAGGLDMFVAKYSATGAFLWAKQFGSANGDDSANGIAVDAGGNVIVTGYFAASVDFGGGSLTAPYLGINSFLAKFSPTGAHLWSESFVSYASAYANSVAVDANDNVLLAGYFLNDINLGGGTLSTHGGSDAFVAKFSSAGTHVWSKSLGGTTADQALGISADPSGNVVVLGFFSNSADFGGGALTTVGGWDTFVAKYSATGAYLWAKSFNSPGNFDMPRAIGVDRSGNVVITGYFSSSIDLGGGLLSAVVSGMQNIFVAKYNASGAHVWSERFGGTNNEDGMGIATDGTGNVLVTGYFAGTASFSGQSLTCAGSTDMYLLRLDP